MSIPFITYPDVVPKHATPRLTSIASAAEYADVSARTIRRYISTGLIPGYRVGPRLVKVDLGDLDNLAQRIPTAAISPEAQQ